MNISETIIRYETFLNRLDDGIKAKKSIKDLKPTILGLLYARDKVETSLGEGRSPTPESLSYITQLDTRLEAFLEILYQTDGLEEYVHWRKSINPTATATIWWWTFEQHRVTEHEQKTSTRITTIIKAICWAFTFAIANYIIRAYFITEPENKSIISILMTTGMAIFTGVNFTEIGKNLVKRISQSFLPRAWWKPKILLSIQVGFAITGLISIYGIYRILPLVSYELYVKPGYQAHHNNQLRESLSNYSRALSLNPENAILHHNIATVYEDLGLHDKAIASYQSAIIRDETMVPSANNLARIYLRSDDDVNNALQALDLAAQNKTSDDLTQAILYKNRGWAYLKLDQTTNATVYLSQSIQLKPYLPSAHCLYALVLEKEKNSQDARSEWNACLGYSTDTYDIPEPEWIAIAQERLAK